MTKSRVLSLLTVVFNAALVACEAFSLIWFFFFNENSWMYSLKPYTIQSNILIGVASLVTLVFAIISLVKGRQIAPKAILIIKYVCVSAISVTMITVLVFLGPTMGYDLMFAGPSLFLHLISPILAIVSFIFFEVDMKIKWRFTWLSMAPVVLYACYYVSMVFAEGKSADFYGFAYGPDDTSINYLRMTISLVAMFAGSYVLGLVWWLLNKLMRLIIIGYEYHDEEMPETIEEPKEIVAEPEQKVENVEQEKQPVQKAKSTQKTKSAPANNKYNDKTRVYHISRQKLVGKWQVKLANGEKAIKLFNTQAEAIAYAKQLVRSQGGSIRIHSMRGQLRKE